MAVRKRIKLYEVLGESTITKVSDPDIIRITDEANDMLMAICDITNCGRGGIVDVAIRLLADKFLANDELVLKAISEAVNNRSFIEIARDRLEKV